MSLAARRAEGAEEEVPAKKIQTSDGAISHGHDCAPSEASPISCNGNLVHRVERPVIRVEHFYRQVEKFSPLLTQEIMKHPPLCVRGEQILPTRLLGPQERMEQP